MEDTKHKLEVLAQEVATCQKCQLHKTRKQTVFSRGNPNAKLLFCGEGPGQSENEQGIPFVGVSGQLLNDVLTDLGLDVVEDIYVCNMIKCQPPNNRKPQEEEINQCFGYLEQQINLVQPKVIVPLGNTATQTLTNTPLGISRVHGQLMKFGSYLCIPTYHPSYILRQGSQGIYYEEWRQDLQLAINKSKED